MRVRVERFTGFTTQSGRTIPNPPDIDEVEVAELKWSRDGFSEDGHYYVSRTVSSAVGPWLVQYDPDGKNPGWAPILYPYSMSRRSARAKAAAHAAGITFSEFDHVDQRETVT